MLITNKLTYIEIYKIHIKLNQVKTVYRMSDIYEALQPEEIYLQ